MNRLTDTSGRGIEIGPILAKGGEGAVYPVIGQPDTLAKIYALQPDAERVAKIVAMAAEQSAEAEQICAWPRGLILKDGVPFGLLMKRFDNRKELHVLLGPKSRKTNFPDASYAFLIHVALNLARAVAWLHERRVCIGDLNDRGILIAPNGTVRLIDCDSFQVVKDSKIFGCDVGVPEYTAPELQGRSLRGLVRTTNHDRFALAVLIFRILFMGRHPFAGSLQGGNKEIHEAIAENRYVYSTSAHNQMIAPPHMMPIDQGAGSAVQTLFETAFSRKASQSIGEGRPPATAWIEALSSLRQDLVDCPFNAAHQFVKGPRSCPWCELELRSNLDFFNFLSTLTDDDQVPDIDAIWQAIGALRTPRLPQIEHLKEIVLPSAPLSGERQQLRQRATEARQESERSSAHVQLAAKKLGEAQRALDELTNNCPPNAAITKLENRLKRAGAPERLRTGPRLLYMLGAGTLYWGIVSSSRALQALGGLSLVAPTAIDLLVTNFRRAASRRLERQITSLRRRALEETPELAKKLSTLNAAMLAAQEEYERAQTVHRGLSQAASAAAKDFEESVKEERKRLKAILDAATQLRAGAFARLAVVASEVDHLQEELDRRRLALEARKEQVSHLRSQRDADLRRLRDQDREQQLLAYLDQHYIATANIAGITPALKSALASYTIETAADVDKLMQIKVPGFGNVRTGRMLSWRKHVASGFRYSPTQVVDPEKVRQIDLRYKAGVQKIAKELTAALKDLETHISGAQQKAAEATGKAEKAAHAYAQVKADFDLLQ